MFENDGKKHINRKRTEDIGKYSNTRLRFAGTDILQLYLELKVMSLL